MERMLIQIIALVVYGIIMATLQAIPLSGGSWVYIQQIMSLA